MKTIIKEKAIEIILTLVVTAMIVFTSFYYTTKNEINYLQQCNITASENIKILDRRMNEKDVQYKEIVVKLDYISLMLEEIRSRK